MTICRFLRPLHPSTPRPHRLVAQAALVAVLTACAGTSDPAPKAEAPLPAWTGPTLAAASGAVVRVLDSAAERQAATWVLAPSNRPAGLDTSGVFVFGDAEGASDEAIRPAGGGFAVALPFRVPESQRRFAPEGMVVEVNGKPTSFTTAGLGRAIGRWKFVKNDVVVSGNAPPKSIRITYPAAASKLSRMDPATSGLSPDAYSRHRVLLDDQSREGLLLTTPSTAQWPNTTLGTGARFSTWLTIAPTPLSRDSDGATVHLELLQGDSTVSLGSKKVQAGAHFSAWQLDLSEHEGKSGTLQIRTEDPSPALDYVFLGSPTLTAEPDGDVRRIVIIGVDTLRPDHLGTYGYARDTSPEVDAWARDAVVFDKAWTAAPRTRPSFRSSTTGRLPLEAVCAPNLAEVFDAEGWATAGIVSNIHLNARFNFHRGSDFWWLDGKAKADDQVNRALDWLGENKHRDSYLFLHIMDPHIFYRAPGAFNRMWVDPLNLGPEGKLPKPMFNRTDVYNWLRKGLNDAQKQHIAGLYDGEISYTSSELGRFFEALDALPGKTLVVLHNDHGEELFEHGGFEHNHTLYQDTTGGVLIVRPPGGTGDAGMRSSTPASITDIGATVMDFAGIENTPTQDGISLLPSMRGTVDGSWTRPIPVAHLRYDADQWGVIWQDHKYIVTTRTGVEELYDLAADPGETQNIAADTDTTPYWKQLAAAHRIDIGPGWRMPVDGLRTPWTLTLPSKALSAGVMDPETIANRRVNQAWGEVAPTTPEDVATVSLSDDGMTLTVQPGDKGKGMLYVRFETLEAATQGDVAFTAGDDTQRAALGSRPVELTKGLTIKPGIVLVPPDDEAARMRACAGATGATAAEDRQMLIDLGYIEEDEEAAP